MRTFPIGKPAGQLQRVHQEADLVFSSLHTLDLTHCQACHRRPVIGDINKLTLGAHTWAA